MSNAAFLLHLSGDVLSTLKAYKDVDLIFECKHAHILVQLFESIKILFLKADKAAKKIAASENIKLTGKWKEDKINWMKLKTKLVQRRGEKFAEVERVPNELKTLDFVGAGNFGEVYKCEWRGRHVVTKRICEQNGQELNRFDVANFYDEVSIMAKLRNHRSIINMYGIVAQASATAAQNFVIVMEFCPKKSLHSYLGVDLPLTDKFGGLVSRV